MLLLNLANVLWFPSQNLTKSVDTQCILATMFQFKWYCKNYVNHYFWQKLHFWILTKLLRHR